MPHVRASRCRLARGSRMRILIVVNWISIGASSLIALLAVSFQRAAMACGTRSAPQPIAAQLRWRRGGACARSIAVGIVSVPYHLGAYLHALGRVVEAVRRGDPFGAVNARPLSGRYALRVCSRSNCCTSPSVAVGSAHLLPDDAPLRLCDGSAAALYWLARRSCSCCSSSPACSREGAAMRARPGTGPRLMPILISARRSAARSPAMSLTELADTIDITLARYTGRAVKTGQGLRRIRSSQPTLVANLRTRLELPARRHFGNS